MLPSLVHGAYVIASDSGLQGHLSVRRQAGDELGNDLCCWVSLPGEPNTLSSPQRGRFDITRCTDHRRHRLVAEDWFAGGEVRDDIALSWSTPRWGTARGFPDFRRRVVECAVGRSGPSDTRSLWPAEFAAAHDVVRSACAGRLTCSYDSYDVGIDSGARLFQP